MKLTSKLILLFIIVAFVYSCKKSGSTVSPAASITGTWYVTLDSNKFLYNNVLTYASGYNYDGHKSYKFNSDGTGSDQTDSIPGSVTFTYKVTGSSVTLNFPAQTYGGYAQPAYADTDRIAMLTTNNLELINKAAITNGFGDPGILESDIYFSR